MWPSSLHRATKSGTTHLHGHRLACAEKQGKTGECRKSQIALLVCASHDPSTEQAASEALKGQKR